MTAPVQGQVLWTPPPDARAHCEVGRYLDWLEAERGLAFDDYHDLHRWSITDLEGFWGSLWDFFEVKARVPYERVLASDAMPGAVWFSGRAAELRGARTGARRGRRHDRGPRSLADA